MPQILMPYTVHLDHTLRVTPLNTLFTKGDSAAHRFELTILRAGVQEDLTGCTVMCKFYRMADSTVVSMTGSVEDRKAVAVLNKACYDYIGRFALTIAIKKGEEETTVFYGDGYMHGQNAETSISGEYIIYDINTLIEKIAEIDAATQAANTATSNANTATANANTATGKANTAASTANTAATNANTAKDAANSAAVKINNMTVSATPVATGTATAALSTVDGHYHLALGLPKGDTGATPQISVQVQTGAAGSEASVSVSGTAENPVIRLTIPRGDTGAIENLTINGKPVESGTITLTAADVGALPSGGTAADSSKLGGKAPEYYIQPRNLLDNSDFTNPVNQRRQTEIKGDWNYGIDRWLVSTAYEQNPNGSILITDNGLSMGYWTDMMQLIPFEQLKSKTLTFSVCTENGVYAYTMALPESAPPAGSGALLIGDGIWNDIIVMETIKYDNNDSVMFRFRNARTTNQLVYWAALYEGSYTADTLPPYVPKGYAAELAACNSAPVDVGGGYGGGSLQAYPVGSIYMSATSTSPASLFGGTWEQLKDRFLLGAGDSYDAGSIGGEATHALTVAEIAKHYHNSYVLYDQNGYGFDSVPYEFYLKAVNGDGWGTTGSTAAELTNKNTRRIRNTSEAGQNAAHNNMPPYLAVYMWKRVS